MNLVIQFDDEMFYMLVNSVYTLSENFHCLTFSNDEEIQIMEYRGSDTKFFTYGWYHKNLHEWLIFIFQIEFPVEDFSQSFYALHAFLMSEHEDLYLLFINVNFSLISMLVKLIFL